MLDRRDCFHFLHRGELFPLLQKSGFVLIISEPNINLCFRLFFCTNTHIRAHQTQGTAFSLSLSLFPLAKAPKQSSEQLLPPPPLPRHSRRRRPPPPSHSPPFLLVISNAQNICAIEFLRSIVSGLTSLGERKMN